MKKTMTEAEALKKLNGAVSVDSKTKVITIGQGGLSGLQSCSAYDCLTKYHGYR